MRLAGVIGAVVGIGLFARKQGGRAVPLVVVGHGAALAGLERQTGLGSIERLNLALPRSTSRLLKKCELQR
jgi:hypothetical protein